MYTGNADCSLCEEALDMLDSLDVEFELDVVNIKEGTSTEKLKLRRLYQFDIPVLTFAEVRPWLA